jgi:hypothetical protein
LFDEPIPDADAVLIKVVTIEDDESPVAEALAVRGAVCRPSEDSEDCPNTEAVLIEVLNDDEFSEPLPEALAVLRLE